MNPIRIGMIVPDFDDATSLYRAGGPFSQLQSENAIHLTYLKSITNMSVMHCDIIFMQRPFMPEHLGAAGIVNRCKVPLWIDFDDHMFHVPKDNPMYKQYGNPEIQKNVFKIMQCADVTTVTTEYLKSQYETPIDFGNMKQALGKNIKVVPNAYDERFHGKMEPSLNNKIISWRGSKSHERDLFTYGDVIINFLNENKDWKMEFVGGIPWYLEERLDPGQCTFTDPMDFMFYMEHMKKLRPSIHIVPLHDSNFSRARSNISWIEATCFGAVTIHPRWCGWLDQGAMGYIGVDGFKQSLEYLISDQVKLEMVHDAQIDLVRKEFNLKDVNKLRMVIINDLLEGKYGPRAT